MRRGGLRKAAASRALLNYQQRRGEERRSASPEKTRPEGRADWGRTVVWLSRPNRWRPPARPTHAPASARPGRQPKGRGRVGLERQGRGAAGERVGLTASRWLAAGSSSGFRAAAVGLAGCVIQIFQGPCAYLISTRCRTAHACTGDGFSG